MRAPAGPGSSLPARFSGRDLFLGLCALASGVALLISILTRTSLGVSLLFTASVAGFAGTGRFAVRPPSQSG